MDVSALDACKLGGLHALGLTMQTLELLKGVQYPAAVVIDASLATFCTTIHLRFLWRSQSTISSMFHDPQMHDLHFNFDFTQGCFV